MMLFIVEAFAFCIIIGLMYAAIRFESRVDTENRSDFQNGARKGIRVRERERRRKADRA